MAGSASSFTPLSAASDRVLARLAREQDCRYSRNVEASNTAAVALSALITIYKRDQGSGAIEPMSEAELVAGRFSDGAAKFVFADHRPDVDALLVRNADIDDAVETITASFMNMDRR
jgi:hypothetical protein